MLRSVGVVAAYGLISATTPHPLDLDLCTIGRRRTAGSGVIAVIEDAVDAFNQPFELRPIELVGTAETMHHMGFSPFCLGVADALGEGVIGDG
jgi:hypothetical protein